MDHIDVLRRARTLVAPILTTSVVVLAVLLGASQPAAAATVTTKSIAIASGATTEYKAADGTWKAVASGCYLGSPWAAAIGTSQWIADVPAACRWDTPYAERTVTFRQTFTLPGRYLNPSLGLSWLADNAAQISLNGTRIGGNADTTTQWGAGTAYFTAPATLTASKASLFRPGLNTLTVVLHNWGTPSQPQWGPNPYGVDFAGSVTYTPLPTTKAQCVDGGWKAYGVFENQGDCVSFVATKGRNEPGDDRD